MPTDFAPHNMTSATNPAPYVISASSYFSSLPPYKAFDNVVAANQYWVTNGISTGWLQIYVADLYQLDNYSIRVNSIPEPNRAPKDWTMKGSIDGVNWDTLDTVTGQTTWTSGETRNFTCDVKGVGYSYFRLDVTANNGDAYLQCGEMYLYGDIMNAAPDYLMDRGRNRLNMLPISGGRT